MLESLSSYAILPLIGWTSGINLYLTAAIVGIGGRAGWLSLPAGMEPLKNPFLIALAVILYAVEFVADKIPYVDSLWDSFHTFIRPTAAAAIGFLAGTEHGPLIQTTLALVTGTIALDLHAVKSSSRLLINTSPEPFSNIAASVAEDSAVVFMFWFFIKHPVLALCLLVLTLFLTFLILRALWRFVRKLFHKPAMPPKAVSVPAAVESAKEKWIP